MSNTEPFIVNITGEDIANEETADTLPPAATPAG